MSAKEYSVLGKTEGKRKVFSEWASIELSSKLSLTCGSNVNYYKFVHHLITTLPVGIGKTLATFKTNQQALLSTECLLHQTEGEGKAFSSEFKKGEPQKSRTISSFTK